MYKVILSFVYEIIFAVEKQYVLHTSVCGGGGGYTGVRVLFRAFSLTNPAYNTPPYCYLQPVWLHQIIWHNLTKGTMFLRDVAEHKMCVLITLQLLF
jgi:hypothetical protein